MKISEMRTMAVGLATASVLLMASPASAGDPPPAEMNFSVEGETFTGGERVEMSGRIQPATTPEVIRFETQVFRNETWRAYDIRRTRTTARGRFSYMHDAFPAGKRYRTRAIWAETVDHLSGRTVWDSFRVYRRAHG